MDVAPGGEHFGIAQHVPARRRQHVATVERVNQRRHLVVRVELGGQYVAIRLRVRIRHGVQETVALLAYRVRAEDVQPVRDQRALQLIQATRQVLDLA